TIVEECIGDDHNSIWANINEYESNKRSLRSHIAVAAQLFERVLAFLVLRAARSLRSLRSPQFRDDFRNIARTRLDRRRARITPNRTIAFALGIRKIKRDDRNVFALDIFPNVQ